MAAAAGGSGRTGSIHLACGALAASNDAMQKVFTDPSVIPCDFLKGLLESSGIPAMIKNERGSASAGVGCPLPFSTTVAFAWPEVWVPDEHYEEAATIVAAMTAEAATAGGPWTWRGSRRRVVRVLELRDAEAGVMNPLGERGPRTGESGARREQPPGTRGMNEAFR